MSRPADWLRPADAAMLEYLRDEGPDYVPLVASNLGLVLGYAERRCETLAERGCIESVSQEVVYRVTERGERQLAAFHEARDVGSAEMADDESVTSAD